MKRIMLTALVMMLLPVAVGHCGSLPGSAQFRLTSDAGPEGGVIPVEYSCDGAASSPAMSWVNAPKGTREFALMMTTLPVDGSTRWNWVLYRIPASAAGLKKNGSGAGVLGSGNHGTVMTYDPPCPKGPGAKLYTFTLYALSAAPDLPHPPERVTGAVLTEALKNITIATTELNMYYERQ